MMSASSSTDENKDEQVAAECKVHKPRWLDAFLGEAFFDPCEAHPCRRNELNKYCINCNQSACQYCVSSRSHRHHKMIKIYRHACREVIPLSAMEKHIDCTEIQPYKRNKRVVISLNPLPSCGSASNVETSCNTCNRKLTEPNLYRYCSISCKVKTVLRNDSGAASISTESPPLESQVEERQDGTSEPQKPVEEMQEETSKPQSLRKRKRKGTPHRAPFF